MKKYDDVKISGSDKTGYTVSYYEWTEGEGRDCGLCRTSHKMETYAEAREYAAALKAVA